MRDCFVMKGGVFAFSVKADIILSLDHKVQSLALTTLLSCVKCVMSDSLLENLTHSDKTMFKVYDEVCIHKLIT